MLELNGATISRETVAKKLKAALGTTESESLNILREHSHSSVEVARLIALTGGVSCASLCESWAGAIELEFAVRRCKRRKYR